MKSNLFKVKYFVKNLGVILLLQFSETFAKETYPIYFCRDEYPVEKL